MKKVLKKIIASCLNRRAMVNSVSGIIFLLVVSVTFTVCSDDPSIMPYLNTLKSVDSEITATTAILKGDILILGDRNIIEYGIEISKSFYFSPSQTKGYTTTPSTGVFQVEFTDLEPATLYYYKAYVLINTAQVYSTNNEHFTTKQN